MRTEIEKKLKLELEYLKIRIFHMSADLDRRREEVETMIRILAEIDEDLALSNDLIKELQEELD